ncbi:MAG: hypothetical protein H0W86_03640 [Armatimonadetes bacterium]|nr:hypothetical protein [Armatimonadota bacterium]
MIIAAIALSILVNQTPAYSERKVGNPKLASNVNLAAPLHSTTHHFMISNDGNTVFSWGSTLDRYSLSSDWAREGEVIVVYKVDGRRTSYTMSQSGHVKDLGGTIKIGGRQLLAGIGKSDIWLWSYDDSGTYLSYVRTDKRGRRPNDDYKFPFRMDYIYQDARLADGRLSIFVVRNVSGSRYLDTYLLKSRKMARADRTKLSKDVHPIAHDPKARRLAGIIGVRRGVVLSHPASGARKSTGPWVDARYFFTRGKLYRQGDGPLMEFNGKSWTPHTGLTFIGKSANDRYWLLKRDDGTVWLRTFRE